MIAPDIPISTADVADHYDALDSMYREIWGEHVHHGLYTSYSDSVTTATERLALRIAQLGSVSSGARICDVGCGYGATARLLAGTYGADITALTISKEQYDYARTRQHARGSIRYLLGDWLETTVPDQHYDTLIAIESSEHMPDLQAFYDKAFRALLPGGKIVVAAWLASEQPSAWARKYLLAPICSEGRLFSMASQTEHQRLMQMSGFDDIHCEDISKSVRHTWSVCMARLFWKLLTRSDYRRRLLAPEFGNRIFAITMLRIWLAYHLGAMRYGLLHATKPF